MIRVLGRIVLAAAVAALSACAGIERFSELLGNTKLSMTLKNGEKIEGTLLQKGEGGSTLQINYGTVTVTSGEVLSIDRSASEPGAAPGVGRLAKWDRCLQILAARSPSTRMLPIPATVIDRGIFRNVPYLSHRSGDVEFNVYGDPDQPCSLEIGIHQRVPSAAARRECVRTMLEVLNDPADRETLLALSLDQARTERSGLTFEVTPATAEDAYGGWWISIYDVRVVDQQRAGDRELPHITTARLAGAAGPAAGILKWKEHELKMARPGAAGAAPERVFLRGVHRKNGVYVAPKSL